MNAGTPTSAAPGVSVRGRMRSATAPAIAACAGGEIAFPARRPGAVDDRQPVRRERDAGEQRRAANRFAPADERAASCSVGVNHRSAHRFRLLISLTAWSQARAVSAM